MFLSNEEPNVMKYIVFYRDLLHIKCISMSCIDHSCSIHMQVLCFVLVICEDADIGYVVVGDLHKKIHAFNFGSVRQLNCWVGYDALN